jgi:hypothetical protein
VFSPLFINGQTTFNKRYDWMGDMLGEQSFNIEQTPTGYIVSRVGTPPIYNNWRFGFLMIDENGEMQGETAYADSSILFALGWANSGDQNDLGEYIGAGNMATTNGSYSFLVSYNEFGDTLFTRTYGVPEKIYVGYQGIFTNDGGSAIAGYTTDFPEANTYVQCAYLLKYNASAEVEWIQKYTGQLKAMSARSVIQTSDGGYAIGGNVQYLNQNYVPYDIFVIKTDAAGNEQWREYYGDVNSEFDAYLTETYDGNLVYCSLISIPTSTQSKRGYACKISIEDGTVMWDRVYQSMRSGNVSFIKPIELEDHSLVFAARDRAPVYENGEIVAYPNAGVLAKVTAEGDSLWLRRFIWDEEQWTGGYFWDFIQTPDGGFIACGDVQLNDDYPSQDTWVVKVDEHGCLVPGCHVGVVEEGMQVGFKTYPNPATDIINMYIESNKAIKGRFVLTNAAGQRVYEGNTLVVTPQEPTTYMHVVSQYPRGLYVLSFESDEGVVSEKVVLE